VEQRFLVGIWFGDAVSPLEASTAIRRRRRVRGCYRLPALIAVPTTPAPRARKPWSESPGMGIVGE
jgi:hypothetical protein